MNTNFLSRLTNRTLGAGAIIRPQPVAPGLGRAAEPIGLDRGQVAGDAAVMPSTVAPSTTQAAPTAVAFADDAPALLPPPVTAKAIFPSQSLVRTRPEAQAVAPAAPTAHSAAVPATQTGTALPVFSPLVAPARSAARNNRLHQAPDQTPSVAPVPLMAHPAVGSPAPQARSAEAEVPPAPPLLSAQHTPHLANNPPTAVRTQPLGSATTAPSAPALSSPVTPLVQRDRESRWLAAPDALSPPSSAVPFQAETADNPRYTPLVPASRVDASPPVRGVAEPTPPPPQPTIQVTIGRVEVRAVQPPAPPAARPKAARPRPALSLDAYLQQRKGGRP